MPDSGGLIQANAKAVFLIGLRIGHLESRWLIPGATFGLVWPSLHDLVGGLDLFLGQPFTPDGLSRSLASAQKLREWLDRFSKWFQALQNEKQATFDTEVPFSAIEEFMRHLDAFRTHLEGDLADLNLFFVPRRLAYDTRTLLEQPERLFGGMAIPVMCLADADVREAARCFALGAWTAASFHLLRACELVLIDYCGACGVKVARPGWSDYIKALSTARLPAGMKGRLSKLKTYDRNETMHPKRMMNQGEAETLFPYVIGVMTDMLTDALARRRATSDEREA